MTSIVLFLQSQRILLDAAGHLKCPNVIYGAHGIVYHLMYNKTTTTATAEQQR